MVIERLNEAGELHRAGRLDEAERLYKSVLRLQANQPDALHYLGVVAHQRGDQVKAMELIQRAIRLSPTPGAMHANLAEVQRVASLLDEAHLSCRRALEIRPDHPEAHLTLALIRAGEKDFVGSEAAARTALQYRPIFQRAELAIADALREQGRVAQAEAAYLNILASWPDDVIAQGNLGLMLIEIGRMEDGFAYCRRAALLEADDQALLNLAKAQFEFGLIDDARETLEKALERTPNAPELSVLVGRVWAELGERFEARQWFGRALQLAPALSEAKVEIAELESEIENQSAALEILDTVLAAEPDHLHARLARAKVRLASSDVDGAVADHQEAIRLRPGLAAAHAALGNTLSTAGDINGAVASLRRAIELNPQSTAGYSSLLTTLRHKASEAERDAALTLLDAPWMTDKRKSALNFGLAAYYDGAGQWAEAAERMLAANAQRKTADEARNRRYDPKAYEAFVDDIIHTFTPELFQRLSGFGSDSVRPVFIVGMPRSGTTLTEQIIASHPEVFGAGERAFAARGLTRLPDLVQRPDASPLHCLEHADRGTVLASAAWHLDQLARLDGGVASRSVDKMPDNYHQLGWLALLFPKASFIYCRRDLRDVALSCWITNFSEIRWANDLAHLTHRIEQHLRLMAHWRRVLPVPVLEVDYEAMVADQEVESRRLIDWVGLDWNASCLDFHHTKRLVRTASVSQVREPIYGRSVERWKRYDFIVKSFAANVYLSKVFPKRPG